MQFENLDINKIGSDNWSKRADQPGQMKNALKIVVNPERKFQTIKGIGGAFSELGAKALSTLTPEAKEDVLKDLFSEDGCNLTFCRIPVGANDFSLDAYSLDDVDNDFEMQSFSIKRDKQLLIPFIKDAMRYNGKITLHACPWTPPAWLKTNKDFVKGGSLVDSDEYYKAYALYLCKFIKAYKEQGITIERLVIQNEVDSPAAFPSCIMDAKQMAKLVSKYIAPLFRSNNIDTELWAGTFRSVNEMSSYAYAEEQDLVDNVEGFAFQYTVSEYLNDFKRKYPYIKIMHTESVCYRGENTPEMAFNLFYDFMDYIKAGCDSFTYWNMVLQEDKTSTWGWPQNSLVTVLDDGGVRYNPDFWTFKELAKNIKPGSIRIEAFCHTKKVLSFLTPEGDIITFCANISDHDQPLSLYVLDKKYDFVLPKGTLQCLRCRG